MRRRGYTPEAIRNFCGRIGVSKTNGITELALLEYFVREDLNKRALRVMAVLRPLRVVIDNYPEGQVEEMEAVNNPEDAAQGTRTVPFSRVLYIEQDDFREDPPKQYFRLVAGPRSAAALRLLHHLHERGEGRQDRRGDRDPLHLRSGHARRQCAGRPQSEIDHSLGLGRARRGCRGSPLRNAVHERKSERSCGGSGFHGQSESELARSGERAQSWSRVCADAAPGSRYQFERLGYFCVDPDTTPEKLVFNRTVALRDTWAKIEKKSEMIILGLGGIINDPACAVLKDGELAAAVEQKQGRAPASSRAHLPRRSHCERARARRRDTPPTSIASRWCARSPQDDPPGPARREFPNAQLVMVEHHAAHAASAYYPSPFEEATVLTLDRDRRFPLGARWRAAGNQLHLGTRAVLSRFARRSVRPRHRAARLSTPRSDEHKVQWLSTCDAGEHTCRCLKKSWDAATGPAIDRSFFDADRLSHGGFSAKFYRAARPGRRRANSRRDEGAARGRPAARHRAVPCCAWPAMANILPGRRPGAQRAAGQRARTVEASVRAARGRQCRDGLGRGASTPGTTSSARHEASLAERSVPGPQLRRRRDQAGARKLQAALPLSADHRRADRLAPSRRSTIRKSSPGCRAAWSLGRARWATAASWPRR